eukprot:CAMPEP_0184327992 /NCGR_PEP_ID=MMETSP1049-20130417/143385_1 /TAXON_ID=77928 /ORGANISM="Proteomonas sulcata, Strain CCMP704" /LENGTH=478 /DNA_ID=CAMNT_0026650277 /DNA_START=21 /DNA_END=1457 /DNA_ORIENTATION=-
MEKNEEREQMEKEAAEKLPLLTGPLDPLLQSLFFFRSQTDLTSHIRQLYQTLDTDDSNSLDFREVRVGLAKLRLDTPIDLSADDWGVITENGLLCRKDGELDYMGFEAMVHRQLEQYAHRRLMTAMYRNSSSHDMEVLMVLKMLMVATKHNSNVHRFRDYCASPGPAEKVAMGANRPRRGSCSNIADINLKSETDFMGILQEVREGLACVSSVVEKVNSMEQALSTMTMYPDNSVSNLCSPLMAAKDRGASVSPLGAISASAGYMKWPASSGSSKDLQIGHIVEVGQGATNMTPGPCPHNRVRSLKSGRSSTLSTKSPSGQEQRRSSGVLQGVSDVLRVRSRRSSTQSCPGSPRRFSNSAVFASSKTLLLQPLAADTTEDRTAHSNSSQADNQTERFAPAAEAAVRYQNSATGCANLHPAQLPCTEPDTMTTHDSDVPAVHLDPPQFDRHDSETNASTEAENRNDSTVVVVGNDQQNT